MLDASGKLFRVTEFADSAKRQIDPSINPLLLSGCKKRCREDW
ncbi:hypothetical protein [Bradyrhizobium sp.]